MMQSKILIWGTGKDFFDLYNVIRYHQEAGDFEVTGYVSRDAKKTELIGKEILRPKEIRQSGVVFDYILVASERFFKEITEEGTALLKIGRDRFINAKVLKIPGFHWKKYLSLYHSGVSIIAESCVGGAMYKSLGLPFCSPFVNVRVGIKWDDYFHLLQKLDYYMQKSPSECAGGAYRCCDWHGWEGRIEFPMLWYDDILLHGFHYQSQEAFFEVWEKRRKRYNPVNKWILKILYSEKDVEYFGQLDFPKKLGFYYKNTNDPDIVTICPEDLKGNYAYTYARYIFNIVRSGEIFQYADIFGRFLRDSEKERKKDESL